MTRILQPAHVCECKMKLYVQKGGALNTKVIDSACNYMYIYDKNIHVPLAWPLRVPCVSRLSCSWCVPYLD